MAKITGTLYSIEWRGYNCPEGWPRVLAEMFMIGHSRPPAEILNFPFSMGGGYSLTVCHVGYPITPMKPETLARVRKQRAERRIKAKVPLLVDHFLSAELGRKPAYYAGITDSRIEAERDKVLADEWVRYNDLISRAGKLVVYASEPEECKRKAEALLIEIAAIRASHPSPQPATQEG